MSPISHDRCRPSTGAVTVPGWTEKGNALMETVTGVAWRLIGVDDVIIATGEEPTRRAAWSAAMVQIGTRVDWLNATDRDVDLANPPASDVPVGEVVFDSGLKVTVS